MENVGIGLGVGVEISGTTLNQYVGSGGFGWLLLHYATSGPLAPSALGTLGLWSLVQVLQILALLWSWATNQHLTFA